MSSLTILDDHQVPGLDYLSESTGDFFFLGLWLGSFETRRKFQDAD